MPTRSRLAAAALGATAVATIPSAVFATSYVVRPGDTASDIAVRHGTTVAALLDANRMAAPELIRVGQMLQIPDASLTLPAYARGADDSETYRVGRGEGVFETARRFGVDPTALARTNGIGVNAPIAEGDELVVPGRLTRMNALVSFVAADVGVDARLLRGVAWAESQWRQERVSADRGGGRHADRALHRASGSRATSPGRTSTSGAPRTTSSPARCCSATS